MNVLVTVARTPFVPSAAGERGARLVERLTRTEGVSAELMTLPSTASTGGERRIDEAALFGLLRTVNADRMIALNFPAYLLPYPSSIVWVAEEADLPPDEDGFASAGRGTEIARMLARADAHAFARAERLFCGSAPLRDRIEGWSGCRAELLPVPAAEDDRGWADAVARLVA